MAVAIAAYGIGLAAFSRPGFPTSMRTASPFPHLCDKPVGEDAYYMMTVARNIARGEGIVYNGGKRTTGIQPLVTFLYAGAFWIVEKAGGDRWALVRAVLVIGIISHILLALLLGRISMHLASEDPGARAQAYVLGSCFALLNFTLFRLSTYGLETSIYLIALTLSVLTTIRFSRKARATWRDAAGLGCLFGIAALIRIDFLAIASVFLLIALLRRKLGFWQTALTGSLTLLFVSPWLLWVKSVGGSWMPSSGQTQSIIISSESLLTRLGMMAISLADHATPWAYEANRMPLVLIGALSILAVITWLWRNNEEAMNAGLRSVVNRCPFCFEWAVSLTGLVLVYSFFFWSWHFFTRYSAPVLILGLPIMAALFQKRLKASSRRAWAGFLAVLLVSFSAAAFLSLHTGRVGNSLSINAGFVEEEFPKSAKVGAFQSGVLGFFNRDVSNLDGKIDVAALRHLKSKNMAFHLDEEGINVLIDWPGFIQADIDGEYLKREWIPYRKKVPGGRSICLVRKAPR